MLVPNNREWNSGNEDGRKEVLLSLSLTLSLLSPTHLESQLRLIGIQQKMRHLFRQQVIKRVGKKKEERHRKKAKLTYA